MTCESHEVNCMHMLALPVESVKLSKRQIRNIIDDPVKTAGAVNLIYVNDKQPGISRVRTDDGFQYYLEGKLITDDAALNRIRRLALPPAWESVWICSNPDGHLQATGMDSKNRKQYKYHSLWNEIRNETKFFRMLDFGKVLPDIRASLKKDLAKPGLPVEKILATMVSLMERSPIRVGNDAYEKANGSYGLTTLKNRHARINGSEMVFAFRGKKGIMQKVSIRNRKLAGILRKCKDIPGKELFQYYDEQGEIKTIDSGMVNDYIREISGGEFTAKDFRTWAGTVQAFLALSEAVNGKSKNAVRKNILDALDRVSSHLGNTRNVCKKYYVHPVIISMYEADGLNRYFKAMNEMEVEEDAPGLTRAEKMVIKVLSSI